MFISIDKILDIPQFVCPDSEQEQIVKPRA